MLLFLVGGITVPRLIQHLTACIIIFITHLATSGYQPFNKFSYPILCISTPSDVKFYLPNKDVHHCHVFNCLYLNTIETVVIDITLNFVLLQMKKKIHSGGTIGKYVCPAYGRLGVRIPGCNHEIVRVSNR